MSFYKEELANTLSEQSFGIASYSLGESSSDQANASVELLEKVLVNISVSARGFQVNFAAKFHNNFEYDSLTLN